MCPIYDVYLFYCHLNQLKKNFKYEQNHIFILSRIFNGFKEKKFMHILSLLRARKTDNKKNHE